VSVEELGKSGEHGLGPVAKAATIVDLGKSGMLDAYVTECEHFWNLSLFKISTVGGLRQMARQWLGISVVVLGVLAGHHGSAFAQVRNDFFDDTSFRIPGPGTLTLVGSGLAALAGLAWFRRRK